MLTKFISTLYTLFLTLILGIVLLPQVPFAFLISIFNKKILLFYEKILTTLFLKLYAIKIKIYGAEKLKWIEPPILVISNHQSIVDIPVISYILPWDRIWFAKVSLSYVPLIGYYMSMRGYIFVNRKSIEDSARALKKAIEKLRTEKISLVMFPEGTRSPDGNIQTFKNGFLYIAKKAQVPILPIIIEGTRNIHKKSDPFFLIQPFKTVKVYIGDPIKVENFVDISAEEIRNYYMKKLEELKSL